MSIPITAAFVQARDIRTGDTMHTSDGLDWTVTVEDNYVTDDGAEVILLTLSRPLPAGPGQYENARIIASYRALRFDTYCISR